MADVSAERVERAAATTANPAPLGLCAFALTTFVLSASNAGLIPGGPAAAKIVIGLALFYGGLAQLLAGMWEFRAGNTFGATAFTSYGAFWLAVGATLQLNLIPNLTAFAYFLLGWTIFTVLMTLGTLRTNWALITVFVLLSLTFLLLTIGFFGAGTIGLGGWFGILTALAAWYTALATIAPSLNLPVGARS